MYSTEYILRRISKSFIFCFYLCFTQRPNITGTGVVEAQGSEMVVYLFRICSRSQRSDADSAGKRTPAQSQQAAEEKNVARNFLSRTERDDVAVELIRKRSCSQIVINYLRHQEFHANILNHNWTAVCCIKITGVMDAEAMDLSDGFLKTALSLKR